jgi:type IV pilus assembly protein PilW
MRGKNMHNKIKLLNQSEAGFTMLELMITLSIGLVLFAGVLSVFVGMRTTTAETSTFGELQENGRFAISVLTDDLLKQDFWGDYSGSLSRSSLTLVPAPPALNDCNGGGINNATFPLAVGNFRTIWGQTLTESSPNPLDCFSTPSGTRTKNGSDVIQLKRVIGNPVPTISPVNDLPITTVDNYYLMTNVEQGGIYAGGGAWPVLDNFRTWLYQHHVYYVREEKVGGNYIPVLMQGRLANLNMNFTPVVDGIEMIRFMYGVDTNGNGVINAYISANSMSNGLWDNAGGARILAVKVYVLARSILPDRKYNNTKTYLLGDLPHTVNDNYRRLLFSSTITLYNARVN